MNKPADLPAAAGAAAPAPVPIHGLHHFAYRCRDAEETRHFYEDILGLPLWRLGSFRLAPTTLNLLEGAGADALEVVRLNDCNHHTPLFGEAVHRAL